MMPRFDQMSLKELIRPEGFDCECGRHHVCALQYLKIGRGAVESVPEMLAAMGKKRPFVVCDQNTYEVAGRRVCEILDRAGVEHGLYVIPGKRISPAEWEVGSDADALRPQRATCMLGVGSGVVNDTVQGAAPMPSGVPERHRGHRAVHGRLRIQFLVHGGQPRQGLPV